MFFGFFFFFFFSKIKKIKSNFNSNLVSIEKLSFRLLKEVNFTRKFSNFGRNLSKILLLFAAVMSLVVGNVD